MLRGSAKHLLWWSVAVLGCGRIGFDRVDRSDARSDGAGFQVVFDNAAGANNIVAVSYPLTVSPGVNRALAVVTHVGGPCGLAQPTVASVSYGGVALVLVRRQNHDGCLGITSDLWALPPGVQPAVGTFDVDVTLTGRLQTNTSMVNRSSLNSGAFAASGVDQASTFTSVNSSHGNGASATVTLSASGPNDLVIQSACSIGPLISTPQTMRWLDINDGDNPCVSTGGATADGGTTNVSWTLTDVWVMLAASFRAAAASTVTLNATSTAFATGSSDRTSMPFTVGSGPNRALAVFTHLGMNCGAQNPVVLAVNYAGVPLSNVLIEGNEACPSTASSLWAWPAGSEPPSGTQNVDITLAGHLGQAAVHFGAISASGVDPNQTFAITGSSSGDSGTATLNLPPSSPNDLVIASVCTGSGIDATPPSPRWLINTSFYISCDNSAGATAPGGTTDLTWSVGSDLWNGVGAAFKAAP